MGTTIVEDFNNQHRTCGIRRQAERGLALAGWDYHRAQPTLQLASTLEIARTTR
jgi:hypothetical protein